MDLVISGLYPDYVANDGSDVSVMKAAGHGEGGWLGKTMGLKFLWTGQTPEAIKPGSGIPIRGTPDDLPIRFAPKGGALPGERIVGIMTPWGGHYYLPDPCQGLAEI